MRTPACSPGTAEDFHPLEIIPFFRRFRRAMARDLLYTLIWNCGLGVMSTLVNMNEVASTRRDLGGRVFVRLRDGRTELPVSRAYAHLFKHM